MICVQIGCVRGMSAELMDRLQLPEGSASPRCLGIGAKARVVVSSKGLMLESMLGMA